jgi:hypothetical protein
MRKIFRSWDRIVKSPVWDLAILFHINTKRDMEIDIVTKQDLQQFKTQFLNELKELLQKSEKPKTEWLRSKEVRAMLKISPGTLLNLRVTGVLRYTKVGGMHYYNREDIDNMLKGKANRG